MSLTIYKASAGSGKTFALSATFIAHLVSAPDTELAHRHQLAVTFTNKATAEMKTRILQYLFSLSHGKDDEDGFFKAVRRLVPKEIPNGVIRGRAATALRSIIHDYDHFHVTTIDSFFQSLLSNMAHELGLASSFKVEIGDRDVLSKAVDRLLTHLEEQSPEVEHITDYIRERISDDRGWNVSADLKALAGQILRESYMLNRGLLHAKEGEEGIDLTYKVVVNYKKTLAAYQAQYTKVLVEAAKNADEVIKNGVGYENISNGKRYVGNYLQKIIDGAMPSAPSCSFCKYASGESDLFSKAALKKNPALADEAPDVQSALEAVVDLYARTAFVVNSCKLSRQNVNPLLLLDAIDKEVRLLNEENDRVVLAYTPMLFHNLTGANDAAFIFERAGTQYRHVMIDEFQDTSKLQWDNLHHLLVENMAQGNSCMLVGDVKQGIYRFRGGDWNTLASFRKGYNKSLNADVDIQMLDTNYRSGERIIEFNNRFFVAAAHVTRDLLRSKWGMAPDEPDSSTRDIESIYPTPDPENDSHEVTQLPHNKGGFVRVELYNEEDGSEGTKKSKDAAAAPDAAAKAEFSVKESLAEQILRLRKSGVPFNKMAILVRKQKNAVNLLHYFEKEHNHESENPIPLISEEAFLLEASEAVQTIIYALRCVATPSNEIAKTFIKMKCPKANLEEMETLLEKWSDERYKGLPFYEMSCAIIRLFGLDDLPGQSPYIYSFLDNVITYTEDNNADIAEFLKYWDETLHSKAIPSTAVDGIRLLTIHKSKGLDFHTVFIPYCDWAYEEGTKRALLWLKPSEAPYNDIPLLPITMNKGVDESIYREEALQEEFDTYVENLNLAYVAFTRTRQNLLVWVNCQAGQTLAPMVRGALDEAQLTCEDSGYGTRVYESGSPSALECVAEVETDEKKDAAATGTQENVNPLDFDAEGVSLDFTHYEPRLSFRQSTNARVFLNVPTDESEGAVADADGASVDTNDAAQKTADQRETYRQTGILLHLLMASVESRDEVDAKVDAFAQAGMLPPTLTAESVKRLIRSRIDNPKACQWFDGTWTLFRECSLLYKEEGEVVCKRPDRVMMRGDRSKGTDEMIVVDFKFGRHEKEHEDQVALYKDLLRRQGASHVKGYLWYLYNGDIQEV